MENTFIPPVLWCFVCTYKCHIRHSLVPSFFLSFFMFSCIPFINTGSLSACFLGNVSRPRSASRIRGYVENLRLPSSRRRLRPSSRWKRHLPPSWTWPRTTSSSSWKGGTNIRTVLTYLTPAVKLFRPAFLLTIFQTTGAGLPPWVGTLHHPAIPYHSPMST